MNTPVYFLYLFIVCSIKLYKFLEYQVLKLFLPLLTLKARELTDTIGVVLHCNDSYDKKKEVEKFAEDERQRGLTKYEKILHFKIHSNVWFARIANQGMLAAADTYIEKMWDYCQDVNDLSEFATRALENNVTDLYYTEMNINRLIQWVQYDAFNLNTVERKLFPNTSSQELGTDLFEIMLDPWMQYSSGYWKDTNNLNDAQLNKMELIAQKLDLKPGMRVLDIGCGFGTLCKYLAENYHVQCVGTTVDSKTLQYAKSACTGLPVEIRLQDFRQLDDSFDRIVSVGMFEQIGAKNYREFFQVVNKCLANDGIFLLHTIGRNHTKTQRSNNWSSKFVFPYGSIPNPKDVAKATKDLFIIEDWHNFGSDYAKTLLSWRENFISEWPKIETRYGGDKFYRMWIIYLCFAQALFQSRKCQVWQLALSKNGLTREYRAAR